MAAFRKNEADEQLTALRSALFAQFGTGRFAVAFSGGLDSRFLAYAALRFGYSPLLLHASGPQTPERETAFAVDWAKRHKAELRVLAVNPLAVPEVAANGRDRCWFCKHALFSAMLEAADRLPLCDGTNASDSLEYRPGVIALRELGIRSPLAEAGLEKSALRAIGAAIGLDDPDQRARPCLMTRFMYGLSPTPEELQQTAAAEACIERLLAQTGNSVPDFRLRRPARHTQELHILLSAGSGILGEEQAAGLREAVLRETGIPLAAIRCVDTLSGYFDRKGG